MKDSEKPKVLFLHYHDAPYRTPVLNLAKRDSRLELFQLAVMFPQDKGHSYWKIDYDSEGDILLGQLDNKGGRKWHSSIRQLMKSKQYGCLVVNGFYHYTSLYLLWVALTKGMPTVFVSDNVIKDDWGFLKRCYEGFKIRILNHVCNTYWVPGKAGADYLIRYGKVDRESIYAGAYTMESSEILAGYNTAKIERQQNRSNLGFSNEDRVFMMAANFLDNREHTLLVEAFLRAQQKHKKLKLVLLGEGHNLSKVKNLISAKGASRPVLCLGGVGFNELASYYSLSDVYIHSGSEPYSTAVMYAALVGMPLVLSQSVGATLDILEDGINGYSFKSNDLDSLEEAIVRMGSLDIKELDAMSASSAEIAQFYNPGWGADQLVAAIFHAIA